MTFIIAGLLGLLAVAAIIKLARRGQPPAAKHPAACPCEDCAGQPPPCDCNLCHRLDDDEAAGILPVDFAIWEKELTRA